MFTSVIAKVTVTATMSKQIHHILADISKNYDVDYETLKNKYIQLNVNGQMKPDGVTLKEEKEESVTVVNEHGDMKQVTRDVALQMTKEHIVAGGSTATMRKKKQSEDYIEVREMEYDNVVYLVDGENNVYTNNARCPRFVGKKLVNGVVVFA